MQILEKRHRRIDKLHYVNISEFLFLFLMEHILKKFLPLLTAFFLSSWNRKWRLDTKSHLLPSWSKPSFNLCGNAYEILLFYKGAVIIFIFQTWTLRLQETWGFKLLNILLTSLLRVENKYGLRTQCGWPEYSLFPSYAASITVFPTLVKSMPLTSQHSPHPTSLHSEVFIFPYKVPLFEKSQYLLLKKCLSSLPFIDFVKLPFLDSGCLFKK